MTGNSMGAARHLVIMVKEPVGGRVKTRLGRDVGLARATGFYRHTCRAVVARLAADARWHTTLAVAPAAALRSRMFPTVRSRVPQTAGDLGNRMQALLELEGAGSVVVIGTDIPDVRPAHVWAAFRALGEADVVFGPATDGGFWLVGANRVPRVRQLFDNVRWSTAETLPATLVNLAGCRVARVATLADVDHGLELAAIGSRFGRVVLPVA